VTWPKPFGEAVELKKRLATEGQNQTHEVTNQLLLAVLGTARLILTQPKQARFEHPALAIRNGSAPEGQVDVSSSKSESRTHKVERDLKDRGPKKSRKPLILSLSLAGEGLGAKISFC
jgi:hypothetical protein